MTPVWLVGLFERSGATAARTIRAVVTLEEGEGIDSNVDLAPELRSVVELALATAVADFGDLAASRGLVTRRVVVRVEDSTLQRLADRSYGLPLYAALVGELLSIELAQDLVGTGTLGPGGVLMAVQGVYEKVQAVHEQAGIRFLVHPEDVGLAGPGCISAPWARTAACAFLGPNLLERAARQPATWLDRFEDLMTVGGGIAYPPRLGHTVALLVQAEVDLALTIREQWPRFLKSALHGVHQLGGESFRDRLQLLCPLAHFPWTWANPDAREDFLHAVVKGLVDAAVEDPEEIPAALHRLNGFLRLLPFDVDPRTYLREGGPILAELSRLFGAITAAGAGRAEVDSAAGQLGPTLSGLIYGAAPAVYGPTELAIHVEFDANGMLEALGFEIPGGPGPERLRWPAALFDHSGAAPAAWRRRDWRPTDVAIGGLRSSAEVLRRFGTSNEIVFPPIPGHLRPVVIRWGDGGGTWPPSIDTLHLVGVLRKHGVHHRLAPERRLLDIGCGTGVHGVLLARSRPTSALDLIDSEPSARATTSANVLRNCGEVLDPTRAERLLGEESQIVGGHVVRFFAAHAQEVLPRPEAEGLYDLAVCTPPYVPFVDVLDDPGLWRAVAGTELLTFVLGSWRSFTRRLIVQFSEIALPEVEPLLDGATRLHRVAVAFRIPSLMKYFGPGLSPRQRAAGAAWWELVRPRLLDTETADSPVGGDHHGFRYFHWISTFELRA